MARNARTTINAESVTTSASELLAAWGRREVLVLQADPGNGAVIYVTVDGSTPSSSSYHVALDAGDGLVLDRFPPGQAVKAVAASGTQTIGGWEA